MFDGESIEKWWKSALVFKVYSRSPSQKVVGKSMFRSRKRIQMLWWKAKFSLNFNRYKIVVQRGYFISAKITWYVLHSTEVSAEIGNTLLRSSTRGEGPEHLLNNSQKEETV